jgi:hypothetical protein
VADVGGLVALFGKDTQKIGASEFTRGKLNENGEYVESNLSIYTKDAFPCQGLRIVPDFEASGEFQVFYYDDNNRLLDKTELLSAVYEEDFPGATMCRVVYYPEKPADVKTADWKIGLLEVSKYAKQLTITVDKDQAEYKSSGDLFTEAQSGALGTDMNASLVSNAAVQTSNMIAVDEKYDIYRVYIKTDGMSANVVAQIVFGDESGKFIYVNEDGKVKDGVAYTYTAQELENGTWSCVTVEVPAGAENLRVQFPASAEVRIYGVEVK